MLFDYLAFLEELREHINPEKRKIIEQWDTISSARSIEEEPYYSYLSRFAMNDLSYKIPVELSEDFDWQLLFQLAAGSFSSDFRLNYPDLNNSDDFISADLTPELSITVTSGNASLTKNISDLWSFQILRLYEIYTEEQIKLHTLKCGDEEEKIAIDLQREIRLKKFYSQKRDYLIYKNTIEHRILRKKLLDSIG